MILIEFGNWTTWNSRAPLFIQPVKPNLYAIKHEFDWELHVLLNIDRLTSSFIQTQFQQVSKLVWSWYVYQPRGTIYRIFYDNYRNSRVLIG